MSNNLKDHLTDVSTDTSIPSVLNSIKSFITEYKDKANDLHNYFGKIQKAVDELSNADFTIFSNKLSQEDNVPQEDDVSQEDKLSQEDKDKLYNVYKNLSKVKSNIVTALFPEFAGITSGVDELPQYMFKKNTNIDEFLNSLHTLSVLDENIGQKIKELQEGSNDDEKLKKFFTVYKETAEDNKKIVNKVIEQVWEFKSVIRNKISELMDTPANFDRNNLAKTTEKDIIKKEGRVKYTIKIDLEATHTKRHFQSIDDIRLQSNEKNTVKLNLSNVPEINALQYYLRELKREIPKIKKSDMILPDHVGGDFNIKNYVKKNKDFYDGYSTNFHESSKQLGYLSEKLYHLHSDIKDLNTLIDEYVKSKNMSLKYLMYVLSIGLKDKIRVNKEVIYFLYMPRGIINLYHDILRRILDMINSQTVDNRYIHIKKRMNNNYRLVVNKLYLFTYWCMKNLRTTDIVDINECTGEVAKNFVLLNEFKDILESFHEFTHEQVSIYARINDWGKTADLPNKQKLFLSNEDDYRKLKLNTSVCNRYKKSPLDPQFTQVFDTDNYPNNDIISKYMSLETQLAKGKGVMILTYGYSGVGKTVTLFGTETMNGMLQSTLKNIKNLKKLYLRVYELYGTGTLYTNYWQNEKAVDQKVIYHTQKMSSTNGLTHISPDEEKLFSADESDIHKYDFFHRFIRKDNYNVYDEEEYENILNNFNLFIKDLDKVRSKSKRIASTPNNPESSRSIVVYDMLLETGSDKDKNKKKIPFVIVDLPGREEIIETYVDTYLKKYFVQNMIKEYVKNENKKVDYRDSSGNYAILNKTKNSLETFHEALLSGTTLNPLALGLLVPKRVINYFNNLKKDTRVELLDTKIRQEHLKDLSEATGDGKRAIEKTAGEFIFLEEPVLITTGNTVYYLKKFAKVNKRYKVEFNNEPPSDAKKSMRDQHAIVALSIINRMIILKHMDKVIDMLKKIIDDEVNVRLKDTENGIKKNEQKTIQFIVGQHIDPTKKPEQVSSDEETRRNIISKILKDSDLKDDVVNDAVNNAAKNFTINDEVKNILFEEVHRLISFDFFKTPFEGIYINENINGLVKYMSSELLSKQDDELKNIIQQQELENLYFSRQQNKIRHLFRTLEIKNNGFTETEIKSWSPLIKKSKNLYSSAKIYNYDEPFMGEVLRYYNKCNTTTIKPENKGFFQGILNGKKNNDCKLFPNDDFHKNIKPVRDFKVFYLFTNTMLEFKCKHQLDLLDKTRTFIKALES